mgnify:CR=1 FL=1
MIYYWDTPLGAITIRPVKERWIVFYNEENLGSYHSPRAAVSDVAGGHTFMPSNGADFFALGVSPDLPEWKTRT